MKTRDEKSQEVSELHDQIGKASNAFLIDFKGITVPQVTELRKQVRQTNSGYVVVKNTLALIALKDSPIIGMKEKFFFQAEDGIRDLTVTGVQTCALPI